MHRNLSRNLILKWSNWKCDTNRTIIRSMATVNEVFQKKSEFPSRHIGPRKTDVVGMLDLLGFKVKKILDKITILKLI